MTALVFGEADPRDYMEPLCKCGHMRSEHYGPNGEPAMGGEMKRGEMAPCWHDWLRDTEGCECLEWSEHPGGSAVVGPNWLEAKVRTGA